VNRLLGMMLIGSWWEISTDIGAAGRTSDSR
jgi:hypothetical protein